MTQPQRRLLLLPTAFRIDHFRDSTPPLDDGWFAMVRAPEGLTVIREVGSQEPGHVERWTGYYGDDAHDLDVPGMLAAVIGPLALDGIPVFVTSTFHADLVLVPYDQERRATAILEASGHQVNQAATTS